MKRVFAFIKTEIVLIISFILAVVSVFFVHTDVSYAEMIDFRTLALLFSLMIIMEGSNRLGIFRLVAEKMLGKVTTIRGIAVSLCLICFFSAMLITNDVALITFVPFTVIVLKIADLESKMIPVVILETVAANLGSMMTPIGNPQNLYLFSKMEIPGNVFAQSVFPYVLLSLALLMLSILFLGNVRTAPLKMKQNKKTDYKRLMVYVILFILALLTVFRLLPYLLLLSVCIAVVLLIDRPVLKYVDYSLLFTFIFLFIFIGNLGEIQNVRIFLQNIVSGREVAVAIMASQIFSNVPAAILLSGFTDQAEALLIGTNLGGLGTLIASMASLISFKIIIKENMKAGKYLFHFTWVNVAFLACNILLWLCIQK